MRRPCRGWSALADAQKRGPGTGWALAIPTDGLYRVGRVVPGIAHPPSTRYTHPPSTPTPHHPCTPTAAPPVLPSLLHGMVVMGSPKEILGVNNAHPRCIAQA